MERSAVSRQYVAVVRQQLVADDPRVSAPSSAQPRRRCILATSTHDSTSLEDDGIVERRCWQPTTATPAFRHVAHSQQGCLVSSATTVQLRFTVTTVDCRRWATSRMTAGSGHASASHNFSQLDTSTRIFVRRLFLSTDTFKLSRIRAFSVNVRIKSAACACRSVRPERTQRCRKQQEAISGSSAYTGVAAGAMWPKHTETTET